MRRDSRQLDTTIRQGDPHGIDVRVLAELGCCVAVGLTPILIWVNGGSVSDDQFWFRTGYFLLAIIGAIGFGLARKAARQKVTP